MERFKAVEKDMKTKAFSKVGLGAASKLDPKEKEREEVITFLADMVGELDRQIEASEAEVESLQASTKKSKKDSGKAERVGELEERMEQHKWHQGKLEALRRSLENEVVEIDAVKEVQEGIKYYVENNQEVDFMEDDSIYDEFNLLEDDGTTFVPAADDKTSTQDTQSVRDETPEPDDKPKPHLPKTKSTDASTGSVRRASVQGVKSPLPALATLHTTSSNSNPTVSTNMKPAPIPSIPTGQPLKYASAAAAAAASDKSGVGLIPLPPPPHTIKSTESASPSLPATLPVRITESPQPQLSRKVSKLAADSSSESSAVPVHAQLARTRSSAPSPPPSQPPPGLPTPAKKANGVKAATPPADEDSVFHLPSNLSDILESFQATKARAGTAQAMDERMLAIAHATAPTPLDAEKPDHYRPRTPYAYTPDHYPQEPLGIFDDARLYSKMEVDALFYSFYYRQGTYQQYLAAKALKSQSWRFHKQYQTWFQRHEEPKNITEEYEQGTYRFFDYESTW